MPRIDRLSEYTSAPQKRLFFHYGDLVDSVSLVKLLYQLQPDEIYNLTVQSRVRVSFDDRYLRPAKVALLIGNYSKAKKKLGWEPVIRMNTSAELNVDADFSRRSKQVSINHAI